MKHIVLWSGGADSTQCLIELLRDTDDPVIAIHLHGDMPPNPMDAGVIDGERRSIKALTPIIKERYRDFELKQFEHERFIFDQSDHTGYEVSTFPFIHTLTGDSIRVYMARNADDWLTDELRHANLDTEFATALSTSTTIRPHLFSIDGVDYVDYNIHKRKAEVVYELGELYDLTWSCIGPLDTMGVQCGKCVWCKEKPRLRKEAELIRQERSNNEIQDA